jgi:hypothetical protein
LRVRVACPLDAFQTFSVLSALLLTIATVLPVVAFVILVFWGKKMGTPFAGYVGTAFIAGVVP